MSGVVCRGAATSGNYLTEAYPKRSVDKHCAFFFLKNKNDMKDLLLYDTYKALTSIACIILYLIIKHWFSKPTKKH